MKSASHPDPVVIREATAQDLPGVARIQAACPEAAQWEPRDYLRHDLLVADCRDRVVGFAAARQLAEGQSEILNLAVNPSDRRRGLGKRLLEALIERHAGEIFLEVRESNQIARIFYKMLGFQQVGLRSEYYQQPPESAIVMKFHS